MRVDTGGWTPPEEIFLKYVVKDRDLASTGSVGSADPADFLKL